MPDPVALSSFSPFWLPGDAVVRGPVSSHPDFDYQAYQSISGNPTGFKKAWAKNILPYRFITAASAPSGGPTTADVWSELTDNPDTWWPQVPWGGSAELGRSGGNWQLIFPSTQYVGSWLCAIYQWFQAGSPGFTPPEWDDSWSAFQVICPQLWTPRNYQIWKVTGRWLETSGEGAGFDDTGTFPTPMPWSLSSDQTMVSSGTLHPGQTLVVGPHDFSPPTNCQKPPAPSTASYENTDGQGWGVANYLIFV